MRIVPRKDLEAARRWASADIDREAERARLGFITGGAGQAMVYQAKQAEAHAFQADGTIGPLMQAEIGITAPDAPSLAALWLAMQAQWLLVAALIEARRLTAKAAVANATTLAAIEQATQVDWTIPLS